MKVNYLERMSRLLLIPGSGRLLVLAAATLMVLLVLSGGGRVPVASAGTIWTVTKVADTNDSTCNSDCSLREAIGAAAISGGDTINFAVSGTITLTTGELLIDRDLTITGPALGITVSGNNSSLVFHVLPGFTATISGLTITKGYSGNIGGGVWNQGTLMLESSTVSDNTNVNIGGGGIYNSGTLTLTNSTVSDNSASALIGGAGGGIYNDNGATATLNSSTVSGNSAAGAPGDGGGANNRGTMTLTNSTVSGNTSTEAGGGIVQRAGALTLNNSTVAENSAPAGTGGGIALGVCSGVCGAVVIKNTIVANNTGGNCGGPGQSLTFPDSRGVNLSSDNTCISFAAPSLQNTPAGLDGLALNPPGTTKTHALCPTDSGGPVSVQCSFVLISLAIDAVTDCTDASSPPNTITTDQRGVARPFPFGGNCDIGAYEYHPTGSITICKQTDPPGGMGFSFDHRDPKLPTVPFFLNDNDCDRFSAPAGPYPFTEYSLPPGWQLWNIVCSGRSSTFTFNPSLRTAFTAGDTGVIINLVPGENVTCTFFNCLQLDSNGDTILDPCGGDIAVGGIAGLMDAGVVPAPAASGDSASSGQPVNAAALGGAVAALIALTAAAAWYGYARRRLLN